MKGSSDVSGSILRDVAIAAKLGAQLLELHIVLGKLAAEGFELVVKVLRLDAADPQQLQSAALVAHQELALESGALASSLIARKSEVDALVRQPLKGYHFRYGSMATFFFHGRVLCSE